MATRSTEAVRNGTDADGREPGPATTALGERYVPGTGSPMRWSSLPRNTQAGRPPNCPFCFNASCKM